MDIREYVVTIKLVRNNGACHMGHEIGDEWTFDYMTPNDICSWAWNSIYPVAQTFVAGGTFPWQTDPDVIEVSCPDGIINNIFELRRTLKK